MNKLTFTWLVSIIFSVWYLLAYFDNGEDVNLICANIFLAASFVMNAIQGSKEDDNE